MAKRVSHDFTFQSGHGHVLIFGTSNTIMYIIIIFRLNIELVYTLLFLIIYTYGT